MRGLKMKSVRITRVATNPDYGTFGAMTVDGLPMCVTLEDYKRSNASNISCIPAGQYVCKRYSSSRHPNTFEVTSVEGRSFILFHIGNTHKDTEGCILLGTNYGYLYGGNAILNSTGAFESFMEIMRGEREFNLTIVESF